MRIFSREQALAAGFDPAMYSQYPPEGEIIGRLDFAMTGTLFFRQVVTDIRYYVFLTDEDGSLSPFERMKFFRYTHDGDICRLEIKPNAFGNSSLQSIEIVKQAPVCARSGSCPIHSVAYPKAANLGSHSRSGKAQPAGAGNIQRRRRQA